MARFSASLNRFLLESGYPHHNASDRIRYFNLLGGDHRLRIKSFVNYRWFIFDADGTLFDFDRAENQALEMTFSQLGHIFEPRHAQLYRQINAQAWRKFEAGEISQDQLKVKRFELLLDATNVRSNPETFSERYLTNLAGNSDLIEGAQELVERLVGKVGLILVTNGLKAVQRPRFARSTITDFFVDIVISEEVGAAKPHSRIFERAFTSMNNPRKDEVLIIGDSLTSDIKGGNDYGIDTCWYNPLHRPLDEDVECRYEIDQLTDLLSIVEAD